MRHLFSNSPDEREIRVDRHGKNVSEIDLLSEKFDTEFRQIVPIVAEVLQLASQVSQVPSGASIDSQFAIYNTPAVPNITLEAYVTRVAQNGFISPATLVTALILLDRLISHYPRLAIAPLNVYKFFFVACRVASKVVEIRTLNNKNFAPIGGLDLMQLNTLEATFLKDIKFDLYVDPKEFLLYAGEILRTFEIARGSSIDKLGIALKGQRLVSFVASTEEAEGSLDVRKKVDKSQEKPTAP